MADGKTADQLKSDVDSGQVSEMLMAFVQWFLGQTNEDVSIPTPAAPQAAPAAGGQEFGPAGLGPWEQAMADRQHIDGMEQRARQSGAIAPTVGALGQTAQQAVPQAAPLPPAGPSMPGIGLAAQQAGGGFPQSIPPPSAEIDPVAQFAQFGEQFTGPPAEPRKTPFPPAAEFATQPRGDTLTPPPELGGFGDGAVDPVRSFLDAKRERDDYMRYVAAKAAGAV